MRSSNKIVIISLLQVEGDKLIQNAPECYQLLHEARRYHVLGNEMMSPRTRPRRYDVVSDQKLINEMSDHIVSVAHEIVFSSCEGLK